MVVVRVAVIIPLQLGLEVGAVAVVATVMARVQVQGGFLVVVVAGVVYPHQLQGQEDLVVAAAEGVLAVPQDRAVLVEAVVADQLAVQHLLELVVQVL